MASVNCLVTNILQNIFYVQQLKEIHTGLEQLEGEQMMENYSFKLCLILNSYW